MPSRDGWIVRHPEWRSWLAAAITWLILAWLVWRVSRYSAAWP
jgi:hypothetical protein